MMTADIEALKKLLPKVEAATDRLDDETLGRVICALRGWSCKMWVRQFYDPILVATKPNGEKTIRIFDGEKRFDTSLDAVRALAREVLPDLVPLSGAPGGRGGAYAYCKIGCSDISERWEAHHPTSEPLACLLALIRAKIAEGETATQEQEPST